MAPADGNLGMDWDFDGEEFDEETKLREETRKILGLPELPISATCVRVPVLVGHAEAVWVETEEPLSALEASALLAEARDCGCSSSRPRATPLGSTRFSSAASDAIRPSRTGSSSSSSRTTSARGPRSTLSRSPSSCSSAERCPPRPSQADATCRCSDTSACERSSCDCTIASRFCSSRNWEASRSRRSCRSRTSAASCRSRTALDFVAVCRSST